MCTAEVLTMSKLSCCVKEYEWSSNSGLEVVSLWLILDDGVHEDSL